MRGCGFSRFYKDGGEAGPMAGADMWVGEDVHVDIPGGDRRNRKHQGIAAAPSVHKAEGCPDGEHTHDRFDYCHPEERKHRGGAKAPEEERPFPPSRTANRQAREAFNEWRQASRDAVTTEEHVAAEGLQERWQQLRDLTSQAITWELSPEGKAWVSREKVKRAKGQGLRPREHYEAKVVALKAKFEQLKEEYDKLYAQYQAAPAWKDKETYRKEINENVKQQKAARAGIKRNESMATLGFAREWTDIIKTVAGGVEPHLTAVRAGGKSFAQYSLENGVISISHGALRLLSKIMDNSDLLFTEGDERKRGNYAFAVSSLVHEFLHSVNNAKGAYMKGGVTGIIEEGLTEAISNRMVARADVLSKLLGVKVEQGITAKPGTPAYQQYTDTMEYAAELAARKNNSTPEWFLGKWKFQTDPKMRQETIVDDMGMSEEHLPWKTITMEAREKLPQMKEARQAARENKAFVGTVQKVLDEAWKTLGFVFKNDSYPPETPAPTGGGGGGPTAAPGSLVPANMDVRHTGSPPKGVRWQKLPRQGGGAPGGAGAGAVDAARK